MEMPAEFSKAIEFDKRIQLVRFFLYSRPAGVGEWCITLGFNE